MYTSVSEINRETKEQVKECTGRVLELSRTVSGEE